jgi:hypothetical protein
MLKLFRLPEVRKFKYIPLFYNPVKEYREDRESREKDKPGIMDVPYSDKPYQPLIKGQFRKAMGVRIKSGDEMRRKNNTRLLLFIIILCLLYFLFFYR